VTHVGDIEPAKTLVKKIGGRTEHVRSPWDFLVAAEIRDEDGNHHKSDLCGPILTGAMDPEQYETQLWEELREAFPELSEEDRHNIGIERSGLYFTYSYAVTAHKAQGGSYQKVIVIDEPMSFGARWRYTALTRAEEELIHVL
jgi:hypothetical protein